MVSNRILQITVRIRERDMMKRQSQSYGFDNLFIAASNRGVLKNVKAFLGIHFEQREGQVVMSQKRYVNKIQQRFEMKDCRSRETLCEAKLDYTENAERMINPRKYRSALGSLIYLSVCTRPDISFVVSKLSQYVDDPTKEHWNTVEHVFRYLKGTAEQIFYLKRNDTSKLGLTVHSDADWASDKTDRRSISGYCVSLSEGSSLVSWKRSTNQTTNSCSVYLLLCCVYQLLCLHSHLLRKWECVNPGR